VSASKRLLQCKLKGAPTTAVVMNVVFGPLPAMSASPSRAAVEADVAISRNVPQPALNATWSAVSRTTDINGPSDNVCEVPILL
jgi:hypothetical protein